MYLLAKIIAVVLIVAGSVMMLRSEFIKRIMDYMKEGSRIYAVGVIRIIVGLILMTVSFESRIVWVVFIIGLLALIGGVLIFVMKKDKIFEIAEIMLAKSPTKFNLVGTIPMLFGILLFCAL